MKASNEQKLKDVLRVLERLQMRYNTNTKELQGNSKQCQSEKCYECLGKLRNTKAYFRNAQEI